MKKLLFIPVMVAIVFGLMAFGGKKNCPPEGKPNPKRGRKAKLRPREMDLNRHKNRAVMPQPSDFNNSVTIEGMYNSKDDSVFSENEAAMLTGYLYRAIPTGKESCNCYTEDKSKYNVNLYLSPTPIGKDTRMADCIVAVVTPYSQSINADWTAEKITEKMVGQKVKVSGWLIYDYLHSGVSVETNPNCDEPERRTIWGLCPITNIEIVK